MLQSQRVTYPGLLPAENDVLRAWLRKHEAEYTRFDYNVRVGKGTDPGPAYPPVLREQAIENSRLRVDLVAWRGTQPTVIEVKERATPAVIGQITTYAVLWREANPEAANPVRLIVAASVSEDARGAIDRAGIPLELVQPLSPEVAAATS